MIHEGPIALLPTTPLRSSQATVSDAGSRAKQRERARVAVGSIIGGRYQLVDFVAEGAFGAVYRAHDLDVSGHIVALKLMHRPPASDAEQALCLREVQLIAAVSHPSVVSFKDHGLHQGRFYIVMPWYDGETLAGRIRRLGPLSRAEALHIFRQLAQALAAMHERGIRHQDVKPDNVLLARFGEGQADFPVLLDLGVGAFAHELVPAFTPAYVAPEMARAHIEPGDSPAAVDGKSDVYSLALTLFDALAPEQRDMSDCNGSPEALARRAHGGLVLPRHDELADVMPAFERWLSVDPAARPTAQELVHELSVLTRAEERRAERRRMLLRAGPLISATLAIVTLLGIQLRSERVRSHVKDIRIEEQAAQINRAQRAIERLTDAQRAELVEYAETEAQNAVLAKRIDEEQKKRLDLQRTLNTQEQANHELRSALDGAKERGLLLESQLAAIDARAENLEHTRAELEHKLAVLEAERKALADEHADAQRQVTELVRKNNVLEREQAQLAKALEELRLERDKLAARVEALEHQHRPLVSEQRPSSDAAVPASDVVIEQLEQKSPHAHKPQPVL